MSTEEGNVLQDLNGPARKRLAIYLDDHDALAAGGLALARRCASANANNEVGTYLRESFIPEAEHHREVLNGYREAIESRQNPIKPAAARLGELAGRLKYNGQLFGYSPSSRVIELEGLMAGVEAKTRLWHVLQELECEVDLVLQESRVELDRLGELHRHAVRHAFGETG